MGTSRQTVRNASGRSVFDRYTEATRRAIFFAREEAEHRGDAIITIADLLGGLSVEEDTRADRIASLKANAFYLRWLVGLPALPARDVSAAGGPPPERSHLELDGEARRAFAFALMEADRDGDYWIDSDHLLRGLLRFPNKADFALLKTEIHLSSARLASRQDRIAHPPEPAPGQKLRQYRIRKYAAMGAPLISLVCYLYILMQSLGTKLVPALK